MGVIGNIRRWIKSRRGRIWISLFTPLLVNIGVAKRDSPPQSGGNRDAGFVKVIEDPKEEKKIRELERIQKEIKDKALEDPGLHTDENLLTYDFPPKKKEEDPEYPPVDPK